MASAICEDGTLAICEDGTPFTESVWREFQTRTKDGISGSSQYALGASSKSSAAFVWGKFKPRTERGFSESVRNELEAACKGSVRTKRGISQSIQNELEASSKSSGSKSKKAAAAKKERKKKAAKKLTPDAKKAESSKKVETDYNSMSSDSDWSPDEFPNSTKPYSRPRGTIHGGPIYTPGVMCEICNGEHQCWYCPCSRSVPPDAHINDSYFRCCGKCGYPVDPFDFEESSGGFYCTGCSRRVSAYARFKWWL